VAALERARRNARDAYGPESSHEAQTLIALETAYTRGDASVPSPGAPAAREAYAAIYRALLSTIRTKDTAPTLMSQLETVEQIAEQQHRLAPACAHAAHV